MRFLAWHIDYVIAVPTERGRSSVVEEPKQVKAENALLIFANFEKSDESHEIDVLDRAMNEITSIATQLRIKAVVLNPFAHLFAEPSKPQTAMKMLDQLHAGLIKRNFDVQTLSFGMFYELELKAKGHRLSRIARSISCRISRYFVSIGCILDWDSEPFESDSHFLEFKHMYANLRLAFSVRTTSEFGRHRSRCCKNNGIRHSPVGFDLFPFMIDLSGQNRYRAFNGGQCCSCSYEVHILPKRWPLLSKVFFFEFCERQGLMWLRNPSLHKAELVFPIRRPENTLSKHKNL